MKKPHKINVHQLFDIRMVSDFVYIPKNWTKREYLLKSNNILTEENINRKLKIYDPDVIRTRSLLIWSQTRYRCATESLGDDS